MKKRKIVAMALSVMMAVSTIPAGLGAAAVEGSAIQPYYIPEVGNQFYVEGVSVPTQTNLAPSANGMLETVPAGTAKNANWYNASGVIFEISPTNAGTWSGSDATKDPYLFFSVLALAEQKTDAWSESGNKLDNNYATFWTSDHFCGKKGRADSENPRVVDETGLMYYSDDNGLTWKSISPNGGDGVFRLNLADVKKGKTLIYIPMAEFFYYGGYNGASGTTLPGAYGATAHKRGFTNFGDGIEKLKGENSAVGLDLHSLILSALDASAISGAPGVAASVTTSDLRLVYNVTEEVRTVGNGLDYSVEFYANEPAGVTDAEVKAILGDRTEFPAGTQMSDGRTKYVLDGVSPSEAGELITFTWESESLGVRMFIEDKVMKVGSLQTLPSQLNTTTTNAEESPLWGANAVYAGDSLMYASRDGADGSTTAMAGWPGRIASTYSMTFNNYSIGGRQISSFAGRGNAPLIANQIDKHINAQTAKEREAVEFVILDGGVNDINRDGVEMGAMTADFDGFDVRTYAGGLEYTFATAKRAYPNATIGFIILYQMPEALQSGAAKCQDMTLMRQYIDLTIDICEKWNVPYLNMFDDQEFNDLIDTDNTSTQYMDTSDMLHLNKKGYQLTTPYVAAWMASLEKQYVYSSQILDGVTVSVTEGVEVAVWTRSITDATMTVSVAGGAPQEVHGSHQDGRIKYAVSLDPWQMGDELLFTWSCERMGDPHTARVSAKGYFQYLIASSGDADLVEFAKAMLEWGAAMQKKQGYKTDALCNEGAESATEIDWSKKDLPYNNPNEEIFIGEELIFDTRPVLRLTLDVPNSDITMVAYRVDSRKDSYGVGEYEIAYVVNGKVDIPLGVHELGQIVTVRMMDNVGAWKEFYSTCGIHAYLGGQGGGPMMEAMIKCAGYADAYLYQ